MTVALLSAGPGSAVAGGGGPTPGAEASAFLARTSGLDTTHSNAYINLINGLVADSIWSKLDVLHVYATQDTTTAQLNLVSTSYPATLNGAPTFTADRGYTGAAGSTVYINTGFNPTSATSPKFVQNSAHVSIWNVGNISASGVCFGADGGGVSTLLAPRLGDGNAYFRANMTTSGGSDAVANANADGHYLVSRTASNVSTGLKNGSSILSSPQPSTGINNLNIYALALNSSGTASAQAQQLAMCSIGSGLSSTDVTNFYNRLRTFMTVVGVP